MLRYESPETVATAGTVPPEGQLEAVRVPENATDHGALDITLEPSLAAGMIGGLNYLQHYPYECNEQTVSRFLPNLFSVRALRKLNISNPKLESDLAEQVGLSNSAFYVKKNENKFSHEEFENIIAVIWRDDFQVIIDEELLKLKMREGKNLTSKEFKQKMGWA